jgi:protein O-mannosyl-transferase
MKKVVPTTHKTKHKVNIKTGVEKEQGISRWLPWGTAVLLLILTWFLYKPSLNNKFTNWDDTAYVLENMQVKQPLNQNISFFFTHESATNYHPLTMLSLSLDYHSAVKDNSQLNDSDEPDAVGFHTTSLVFHLLNVLLVFVFIYLLSRKRLVVAAVTALLFAIHPMHVESVAWIAGRKDVLYAFFFLAALIVYMKHLEKQSWIRLLFTGMLFLASLFSKPSAVVFPLILLAIDYFHDRKFTAIIFLEKIPFFILSIVFGIVTFMIQSHTAVAGINVFTFFQRIMFASYGFIMYQYRLLIPLNLTAFYPYPLLNAAGNLPLVYYLSPLVAGVIIGLVFLSTRFTRVISFGYLFYFVSVVLVLQFMSVGNAVMADRYSYMSATGLFFIAAWYIDQAFISKKKIFRSLRWIIAGVFGIYSVFLVKTTWDQTMIWQNSETLWTDVISKYPEAKVSYKNRGNYYRKLNLIDKAMNDYMVFVKINQDDPGVYSNLGNIYGLRGNTEKSLDAYSKSIALDSLNPKTFLNRAITYSMMKQFAQALKDYNKAREMDSGLMEVYRNRSYMLLDMGRYEDAMNDFSRLIRDFPDNSNYFMQRGVCHYQLKQYPLALADFEQSITLNPANGQAFANISATYSMLNDYHKAYQFALKAISLKFPFDKTFLEKLKQKGG